MTSDGTSDMGLRGNLPIFIQKFLSLRFCSLHGVGMRAIEAKSVWETISFIWVKFANHPHPSNLKEDQGPATSWYDPKEEKKAANTISLKKMLSHFIKSDVFSLRQLNSLAVRMGSHAPPLK